MKIIVGAITRTKDGASITLRLLFDDGSPERTVTVDLPAADIAGKPPVEWVRLARARAAREINDILFEREIAKLVGKEIA